MKDCFDPRSRPVGKFDIALLNRPLHIVDADLMCSEMVRIHLNPNRIFLRAVYLDTRHPTDRRHALRNHRVRVFIDGVKRQCARTSEPDRESVVPKDSVSRTTAASASEAESPAQWRPVRPALRHRCHDREQTES